MPFTPQLTPATKEQLNALKADKALEKRFKAVSKCLRLLANNPRHPGLNTHKYSSLSGENGEEVFEGVMFTLDFGEGSNHLFPEL